jgi:hypothetical protein
MKAQKGEATARKSEARIGFMSLKKEAISIIKQLALM